LTPACAGLWTYRARWTATFNDENFICRLPWSISRHFGAIYFFKRVSQPKIAKISLQPPIWGVQGHSMSSMLTFLRSSWPVLVMISSMSVCLQPFSC